MDPNNQKSNDTNDQSIFEPRQFSESEEIRPNMTHSYPWRSDSEIAQQQPQPAQPQAAPQPAQPQQPAVQPPSTPQQPAQSQWTPPTTAMPPAQTPRPMNNMPGMGPQFGGPMAELPPLSGEMPQAPHHKKKMNIKKLLFIGGLTVFALLIIGLAIAVVLSFSSAKKEEKAKQAAITPVSYNANAIKATVNADGTLATGKVQALNKTATFYTAFKQAAMQPIVHTKWDVFYTAKENGKRTDQYTMFDVTADYKSKSFTYSDDAYSNIGVLKTRCIDGQQYTYNGSKLVATAGWQPASDSTTCKQSVVATRMSDGLNTGGLTDKQADTFIQSLNKSQSLGVKSVTIVDKAGHKYLKLHVTVTPKQQTSRVYWGMQNFMSAFQSTGITPEKYPYTYFGPANAGLEMDYYIDPATTLPVFSMIDLTPGINNQGAKVTPDTWSQRLVEYDFPKAVTPLTLDDVAPIAFTTWPEF